MTVALSIVSWGGIGATLLFLFTNIKSPDEGSGYVYLAAGLACCFIIIIYRIIVWKGFLFERHAVMLLPFLTYFLFKLLIDVPDKAELKAFTFGTTGGVLFSLALGIQVSILAGELFSRINGRYRRQLVCASILLLAVVLSLDAFESHLQTVRQDLFRIDSAVRRYQRPANFCVMTLVVISVIMAYADRSSTSVATKVLDLANLVTFALLTALLMLIAQLIGSNLGLVAVLGVAFATAMWKMRRDLNKTKWRLLIGLKRKDALSSFVELMPRFLLWGVVFGGLTTAIALLFFALTPLEPQSFRIFGFEEGSLGGSSLGSRARMLSDNFLQQWAYNPVFGHLRADELTTGKGTYAHSVISVFSHLGIVGGILFLGYIVSLYASLGRSQLKTKVFYDDLDAGVFRIILLSTILGLSAIGTFFTWMPLWFTLGLLFPPVVFHRTWSYKLANHLIRAT